MSNTDVRVRFAPSPTGYLHVGGLRTALYNYAFAKANNGKFILRIEDTDQNRYVEGAVENLINTLEWAGLIYDEGPEKGGEFGPYFQSERLDIYKKYADELIAKGKAYYAFDTPERLQQLREEQMEQKLQPKYDKFALSLSKEEVQAKLDAGEPYVIRLNVEPGPKVVINDIVRGRVEFDRDVIDDQILIKSDGFPTYHLANVVDDHLMGITHVIRGEEWLSSTHKHVLMYEYLGWDLPQFAHLPLLLNSDRSKLSKRQGDVAVESYRDKGYLPEALNNFVALLGWSFSDNTEFFSMQQFIDNFTLEKVHKAGAIFNIEKLNWLNAEHLRSRSSDEILVLLRSEIKKSRYINDDLSDDYLKLIIEAMRERVSFAFEYLEKSPYFFEEVTSYDEEVISKRWKPETPQHMLALADAYERMENPGDKHDYEAVLRTTAESLGVGAGKLIHPVRVATSGMGTGPGVFDLLFILGKEKVVERIRKAVESIKID